MKEDSSMKADKIMNALIEIGVPANLRGFAYIAYAEQLIMRNQAYMFGVTKSLYIDIATAFATSPCNVEHCIRTAIAEGWEVTPTDIKMKIFGNSIRHEKGRPTNSHFLMMLYYYIVNFQ